MTRNIEVFSVSMAWDTMGEFRRFGDEYLPCEVLWPWEIASSASGMAL